MVFSKWLHLFIRKKENTELTINDKLLDMIMRNEGLRLFPYRCTEGKLTIGYGHNLDSKGISENMALQMLKDDIGDAIKDLYIVFDEFYKFTSNRQCALIDMMFNIGLPAFKKFKKMIQAINEGDWEQAALQAEKSKWYGQVGDRSERIVKLMRGTNELL